MKILKLQRSWFGIGLLVLVNAIALAGIAYNRTGEPITTITLTERELALPSYWRYNREENSGIALDIRMRSSAYHWWYTPTGRYYDHQQDTWLNREKLAELGFDVSHSPDTAEGQRYYQKLLPREVILALEYDGPVHQQVVQAAKERLQLEQQKLRATPNDKSQQDDVQSAESGLQYEQRAASRLFAIDAGQTLEALQQRHKGKSNVFFVRARVDVTVAKEKDKPAKITGHIRELAITEVHIPKPHRDSLEPYLQCEPEKDCNNDDHLPRYRVTVAIGQRLEPWILAVEK